jgi:hypothetical protein
MKTLLKNCTQNKAYLSMLIMVADVFVETIVATIIYFVFHSKFWCNISLLTTWAILMLALAFGL